MPVYESRGDDEQAVDLPGRFELGHSSRARTPMVNARSGRWSDTWKRRPGMKGLRFYFSDPQSLTWPDDGNLDWVFPVAERLGIPVSLQASAFLPRVGAIAERHSGL